MERALIDGELGSEKSHLQQEEKECEALKDQIIQLEEDYILQREKVSLFTRYMKILCAVLKVKII